MFLLFKVCGNLSQHFFFFPPRFLVGINASIAEIQKVWPWLYVIIGKDCNWISYCPFSSNNSIVINAVFAFSCIVSVCLLLSYFLAINRRTHNHCCLQWKGVWEIHLTLKASDKLKVSLLVTETTHSLYLVSAVSSHLLSYIWRIHFNSLCKAQLCPRCS